MIEETLPVIHSAVPPLLLASSMHSPAPLLRLLSLLLTTGWFVGPLPAADPIDFAKDIRPILSENCFFCHGPDTETREAGLRLDTSAGADEVIEANTSEESELFQRLISDDADMLMPPPSSNRQLNAQQIAQIKEWIDQGAKWEQHWSFKPLIAPAIPTLPDTSLVRNPIDQFVQSQLAEQNIPASPAAAQTTLLRRLYLDLTGLPPTPEQTAEFLADASDNAYEQLVDRILESPAYGERMAWNWLEAARYADTNGYQGDNERTMWPWRDWVVQSFNNNLPYDQFTLWQLAGDLLPDATNEQILATGFARNHMINGEGGRIPAENRAEYVMDMSETMGTVWLGLTLNCCRCHDHKYDPLTNEEYYQFFAFFDQTPVTGAGGNAQTPPILPVPSQKTANELAVLRAQLQTHNQRLKDLAKRTNDSGQAPFSFPKSTDAVIRNGFRQADRATAELAIKQDQQAVQAKITAKEKAIPKVMVMADMKEPRESFILERGLYNKPTAQVTAGFPKFLPAPEQTEKADRLTLAKWLIDPEHPLTARVAVNRFWLQIFGTGLVKTAEDFGVQGEIPPQLNLLNWLAADFRDSGWDVKRLIRQMVTSHTYRQSSRIASPEIYERDPENRLLARGSRYRLPSWMIRDQALAASGLLSSVSGGPSVNTYQPPGVWEEASFGKKKYVQDHGEKLYRRSLYVFWRRIVAPTMFFDSASRQSCTVNIQRTNTPLHALQTLNNTTYVEAARVLAEKILVETTTDQTSDSDAQKIDRVFQRVLARPATATEQQALQTGLDRSRTQFHQTPDAATELTAIGEAARDASIPVVEHAAWTGLCLAVLNLDETLNRE